jgi:hypothetical protein
VGEINVMNQINTLDLKGHVSNVVTDVFEPMLDMEENMLLPGILHMRRKVVYTLQPIEKR